MSSIGVFDSGFGGLMILKHLVIAMPEYNFIYLGDSARVPYGPRSSEEVYSFTEQAMDFLINVKNCDLVIIACNTASSDALRKIQQEYLINKEPHKRVLGVIIPACEEAVSLTKNNKIGVMATAGTVNSGAFVRELKKLNTQLEVFQNPCPHLVPIIESGKVDDESTIEILKDYLKPFLKNKVDTLILGCTHYEILKEKIEKLVDGKVKIISEGEIIAKKRIDYLSKHSELDNRLTRESSVNFYSTDLDKGFEEFGSLFYGQPIQASEVKL
jgi:glutamate racemase